MTNNSNPTTLYKFRSWDNSYHKLLLTDKKLWVPAVTKLNDPFDCSIPLRYDLMDEKALTYRIVQLFKKPFSQVSDNELESQAREKIKELGLMDPRRLEAQLMKISNSIRDKYGVLSFSTKKDNPLLWSHYSDSYKGFCLGFDYVGFQDPLEKFFDHENIQFQGKWIKYSEGMPVLILSDDEDEDYDISIKQIFTKSIHWSYEDEFRYAFAGKVDFPLSFPESVVSEIILGSEMPEGDRKQITFLAKSEFPNAKLLQAHRKPLSYELEFEQIK